MEILAKEMSKFGNSCKKAQCFKNFGMENVET